MKKEIDFEKVICSSGERLIGEKNDCTVRVVSNSLNIPYLEAHTILRQYGRRQNKHGISFGLFMNDPKVKELFLTKYGVEYFEVNTDNITSIVHFLEQKKQGTFIVGVRGHVTTVKEGRVIDTFIKNWHVKKAWRLIIGKL